MPLTPNVVHVLAVYTRSSLKTHALELMFSGKANFVPVGVHAMLTQLTLIAGNIFTT